jgi:hypothetical protein
MATSSIGELISTLYDNFLELYGDEELASVATAAVINDLLTAPMAELPGEMSALAA